MSFNCELDPLTHLDASYCRRSSSKDGDTESEETDYDEELPAAVPVKHDLARARAKSKLVLAKRKSSGRKKPQSSEEIDE